MTLDDQPAAPAPAPAAVADPLEPEPDFALEHQWTAVDASILRGGRDGEAESPRGWAGMD